MTTYADLYYYAKGLETRLEALERAFKARKFEPPPSIQAETVLNAVAAASAKRAEDITGRSRRRGTIEARRTVAHILRARGHTLSAIGSALGNRDHTTILALLRRKAPAELLARAERLLETP